MGQIKYLSNIEEQDHRFIAGTLYVRVFKSYQTATYILSGIEAMYMIKKRHINLDN
ncbi:transposase-like protein [Bacillus sp. RC97]